MTKRPKHMGIETDIKQERISSPTVEQYIGLVVDWQTRCLDLQCIPSHGYLDQVHRHPKESLELHAPELRCICDSGAVAD